ALPYLHSFPTRRSSDLQSFLPLPFRRCSLSTIASHAPDDGAVDTADVSRTRVITGGAFETRPQAPDHVRVDRRQAPGTAAPTPRSEEHTSELQSLAYLV